MSILPENKDFLKNFARIIGKFKTKNQIEL